MPDMQTPTAPYHTSRNGTSLLRFITCGSVDDGKSTLIGRLLHEANHVADDQLAALRADSKRHGTQGTEIDYALLMDGLSAEREQGITIDIGYRYFSTPQRRFIVADTPGHVQYTRNMATAASTASLAVLLIDARAGLMEQTRRHSLIVSMLGVRHLVLAVNKMDLVGFAQSRFAELEQQYRAFAAGLSTPDAPPLDIVCIPISAKAGDNVATPSAAMPWYTGPTLLHHLEHVDTAGQDAAGLPFRMPVQWVNRPNPDFRGVAGTIASGGVSVGDTLTVLPSGHAAQIARIVTADGDRDRAQAGDAITLTFRDPVDASRGDLLVLADQAPALTATELTARLLWADATPAVAMRSYLMKIGAATVPVRLDPPLATLDIVTGAMTPSAPGGAMPGLNAITLIGLRADQPIVFDRYDANRNTGGFILIDRTTNMTVAMGMITAAGIAPAAARTQGWLTRVRERPWRSLAKAVSWRVTGSLDTFILTFVISGNIRLAASVGGLEVFTKIALYFVHERVWARIPAGLRRGDR